MNIQDVKFKMATTWTAITSNVMAACDSAKVTSEKIAKVAKSSFKSLAQFFEKAYNSVCSSLHNLQERIKAAFTKKPEEVKKTPLGSEDLTRVVSEFLTSPRDENKVKELVNYLASDVGKQTIDTIQKTLTNQDNLPLCFDWAKSCQEDPRATIDTIKNLDDAALADGTESFKQLDVYICRYNKALS